MAVPSSPNPSTDRLHLCLFTHSEPVATAIQQQLGTDDYGLGWHRSRSDFIEAIQAQRQQIDCLIMHEVAILPDVLNVLQEQGTLLPAVILTETSPMTPTVRYHTAEIMIPVTALPLLPDAIGRAMAAFLELSPQCVVAPAAPSLSPLLSGPVDQVATHQFIHDHQQRLAEKLKERLGYLGVYYKRNPGGFLRAMAQADQALFLKELREDYRAIILSYFRDAPDNNRRLDNFVDQVFLADLPIAKVVEIHMDLMDDFSKQLKLEGRSEEVLLDYRLTLIDTLAHLCEMYRRCIPREIPEP